MRSIKDRVDKFKQDAETFFAEELMEKFMPKLVKLIPMVDREIKKYLGDNEKIIIIKRESNGDVTISILKQDEIQINFKTIEIDDTIEKQREKIGRAVVATYSLEECAKAAIEGNIDNLIKTE